MTNAIVSPGVLHTNDNVDKDLVKPDSSAGEEPTLRHFDKVFEDLKQMEMLLKPGRREKFINGCLRESVYPNAEDRFMNFTTRIYEKTLAGSRWLHQESVALTFGHSRCLG